MLYLEDYLEMIEHLPQELRDRFTEMRELDLSVQNCMDSLDKKMRMFFGQCKRGELQNEAIHVEYGRLRREYIKVREDAEEKVNIATQIHDLVERYLRKLDSELYKFKCELEADNKGITEILEKRSLEMDNESSAANVMMNVLVANQKENRFFGSLSLPGISNSHGALSLALGVGGISLPVTPPCAPKDNRYRTPKPEKRRNSTSTLSACGVPIEKRATMLPNSLTTSPAPVTIMRPITPGLGGHGVINTAAVAVTAAGGTTATVAYNLQQLGGGSASNAIAAAASQAIVATQQMQQGRRTASLKASYEAINGAGGGPTEFWINRDLASAASAAAHNTLQAAAATEKKYKKKLTTSHSSPVTGVSLPQTPTISITSSSSSMSADSSVDMLPSSSMAVGGSGLTSLGLAPVTPVTGGVGVSVMPTTSTAMAASRVSSAGSSSTSLVLTPTVSLSINPDDALIVDQTLDGEWTYDPNEPRYCTCNQVSYGDMVACDNETCPYEWFHYACVGITQPPKGKWYCPKCITTRRRGNRKLKNIN